jgi:hypothetical protein
MGLVDLTRANSNQIVVWLRQLDHFGTGDPATL